MSNADQKTRIGEWKIWLLLVVLQVFHESVKWTYCPSWGGWHLQESTRSIWGPHQTVGLSHISWGTTELGLCTKHTSCRWIHIYIYIYVCVCVCVCVMYLHLLLSVAVNVLEHSGIVLFALMQFQHIKICKPNSEQGIFSKISVFWNINVNIYVTLSHWPSFKLESFLFSAKGQIMST
jgi:hypothetical protein